MTFKLFGDDDCVSSFPSLIVLISRGLLDELAFRESLWWFGNAAKELELVCCYFSRCFIKAMTFYYSE